MKHRLKDKKIILFRMLRAVLIVVLPLLAVKAGTIGGNILFRVNPDIIKGIDTQNFKYTLNQSLPVIDAVYNSGNISVSLSGEIKNIVKSVFGFDLGAPITILNSQSSIFYCYYSKGYPNTLAKKDDSTIKDEPAKIPDIPKNKEPAETEKKKEDASGITFEDEKKQQPEENQIIKNDTGNILINNETKFKINIDQLINEPLKFKFDKKGPKVLILHTHTTESYLKNAGEIGKAGIRNWSTNPEGTVVRVGEELAQNLKKTYGIEVIHNGTIHDYPDYDNSYSKSLETETKILKSYPSIRAVFDVHRDGLGTDDKKLRAVTKVNGKNVAQVMFVVGTNQKLVHPYWKENLKFALKLQDKLNKMSPGLAKPIDLTFNRYNQHMSTGGLIIEIGGDGNVIDECLESTKYLARAINDVVNGK